MKIITQITDNLVHPVHALCLLFLRLFFYVLNRNALWKQRELITLLRNPQEDSERGPLSVVMETDAGSLPGEFPSRVEGS